MSNLSRADRDILQRIAWNSLSGYARLCRAAAAVRSNEPPFGFSEGTWRSLDQEQRIGELAILISTSEVERVLAVTEIAKTVNSQEMKAKPRRARQHIPPIDNTKSALLRRALARSMELPSTWVVFANDSAAVRALRTAPLAGVEVTFSVRPAPFTRVFGVAITVAEETKSGDWSQRQKQQHYRHANARPGIVYRIGHTRPVFVPLPVKPKSYNEALRLLGLSKHAGKKVELDWENQAFILNGYVSEPWKPGIEWND